MSPAPDPGQSEPTLSRVLVTGATGKLGSRFVPRLLERGATVRVLVRDPSKAGALGEQGAEVVPGDLLEREAVARALQDVDAVVHLAAFFRGATPEEARRVNLGGTEILAEEARRSGVRRFVFASTSTVYGPGLGRPAREDDPVATEPNFYARSKIDAESALRRLHSENGIGLRILRFSFVYGERDPHVREFLPRVKGRDPAQRMSMVHHADVGQALVRALDGPGVDGRTYNIADDAPMTVLELARSVGVALPAPAPGAPAWDPWEGILDTSRARRELGYRPIVPSYAFAADAGAL